MKMEILEERVGELCEEVRKKGGEVYVVGGYVRDFCLKRERVIPDMDLEVFGVEVEVLKEMLKRRYKVDCGGERYGIYKLNGMNIDIGIPREERKVGKGHKGFEIILNPFLTLEKAARRRDFTINALYMNTINKEIIDPLGGLEDLKKNRLKHCSIAFEEDALRVLRGLQLVGRFGFDVDEETINMCQRMSPLELTVNEAYNEWKKFLEYGEYLGKGLRYLEEIGWLQYYPKLNESILNTIDSMTRVEKETLLKTII